MARALGLPRGTVLKTIKGRRNRRFRHVVCVQSHGYRASLEPRKIYVSLTDSEAEKLGMVRVVDESGDDYPYPRALFAGSKLSPRLAKTLASGHLRLHRRARVRPARSILLAAATGQPSEGLVHGFRGGKFLGDIWVEKDHIRALPVAS